MFFGVLSGRSLNFGHSRRFISSIMNPEFRNRLVWVDLEVDWQFISIDFVNVKMFFFL